MNMMMLQSHELVDIRYTHSSCRLSLKSEWFCYYSVGSNGGDDFVVIVAVVDDVDDSHACLVSQSILDQYQNSFHQIQ